MGPIAITIGAIAGCHDCSYGCHGWVLLLGAIAGGPWLVLAMWWGHARGGIAGTIAECHGGVPLRRCHDWVAGAMLEGIGGWHVWTHFGVKSFIGCHVRVFCFRVEKQIKLFMLFGVYAGFFCLFLEFFLLSVLRCIGHMRPSSPAWARSQSKRCERCEYGKKRVLFKGAVSKGCVFLFIIAHISIVYHCFILAFGFYMSTSHTWHLHKHYTKQSYGRCKGVNPSTGHHLA